MLCIAEPNTNMVDFVVFFFEKNNFISHYVEFFGFVIYLFFFFRWILHSFEWNSKQTKKRIGIEPKKNWDLSSTDYILVCIKIVIMHVIIYGWLFWLNFNTFCHYFLPFSLFVPHFSVSCSLVLKTKHNIHLFFSAYTHTISLKSYFMLVRCLYLSKWDWAKCIYFKLMYYEYILDANSQCFCILCATFHLNGVYFSTLFLLNFLRFLFIFYFLKMQLFFVSIWIFPTKLANDELDKSLSSTIATDPIFRNLYYFFELVHSVFIYIMTMALIKHYNPTKFYLQSESLPKVLFEKYFAVVLLLFYLSFPSCLFALQRYHAENLHISVEVSSWNGKSISNGKLCTS